VTEETSIETAIETPVEMSIETPIETPVEAPIEAPIVRQKSYMLTTRIEEKTIVGRDDAVETAKAWSLQSGQSVLVERTDGKVKMSFRDGGLVDYVYETRKGRSV